MVLESTALDSRFANPDQIETITGIWTFSTNPVFNANSIPETAIVNGSLLARVADSETVTGGWTITGEWTVSGADFNIDTSATTSLEIRSGEANKAKIYHASNNFNIDLGESVGKNLNLTGGIVIAGSYTIGGSPVLGSTLNLNSQILSGSATASGSWIFSNNVVFNTNIAVGTTVSTNALLNTQFTATVAGAAADQYGSLLAALGNHTTETSGNRTLFGGWFGSRISSGAENNGRNFRNYSGGKFSFEWLNSHSITWNNGNPSFAGGVFFADWDGTGNLTGTGAGIPFLAGQYFARILTNPAAAQTLSELTGINIQIVASVATANMTVTEAKGIDISTFNVSGPGTVTRSYGLKIAAATAGLTVWGINCADDIQIATGKKLLLEGTLTTKGDTYLTYNSGSSSIEHYVNNTLEASLLGSTGLDVVKDVRARQFIADGDNAGLASTVSLTATSTTNVTGSTAVIGGIGNGPAGTAQAGWIKVYVGTTAAWLPIWT